MFQRLKGAIDSRIAEEQARQRQAQIAAQPRQAARRRPQNPNGAGQRTSSKPREGPSNANEKQPDPADFVIGDEDGGGTPAKEKTNPSERSGETNSQSNEPTVKQSSAGAEGSGDNGEANLDGPTGTTTPSEQPSELSPEVRTKLRKLERLETKYAELLKAYRTAHARVQTIEPFEASLRENTPLTGIADPSALVEYLDQVKVKGDMVLEELKRVSTDREEYRKKLEQSEKENASLKDEVEELKRKPQQAAGTEAADASETDAPQSSTPAIVVDSKEKDQADGEAQVKSPALSSSRISSLSLFSPKFGGRKEPAKDESEDLFSYDSELPRMEQELQERTEEVAGLKKRVTSLEGDLAVARESTSSMVQTLETSSRELNLLREEKDKFQSSKAELEAHLKEIENQASVDKSYIETLQTQISELRSKQQEATAEIQNLNEKIAVLEKEKSDLESELDSQKAETTKVSEEMAARKDELAKSLQDAIASGKAAEQSRAEQVDSDRATEQKLAVVQGILDTVRKQLTASEKAVADLNQELQNKQEEFAERPSSKIFGFLDDQNDHKPGSLKTRDEAVSYLASRFDLQKGSAAPPAVSTATNVAPTSTDTLESTNNAQAGKKKNKKKKKAGKGQQNNTEDMEAGVPVKVSEDLNEVADEAHIPEGSKGASVSALELEISKLRDKLKEKDSGIDRLSKQIKDQEALKEEIETLRDDLLHQGEEHVEARDGLKQAQEKRKELEGMVEKLEQELQTAKQQIAEDLKSTQSQQELGKRFEELKTKSESLQKDLGAAESLAAARFKDISDLKELLSKAQPELRQLRSEAAELKSVKDDLKNKEGELKRLEIRHDDLKSEMKGLSKRLGDKDSEIKELQVKVDQESRARGRVESELASAQLDARVAENKRKDVSELLEQRQKDLTQSKEEGTNLRKKLNDLEANLAVHNREIASLKEEVTLKTALHSSSQSLLQSLRDQTHELSTQAREASSRAESLDEELAEAQRMLSERTRESQTMRMLLDQAQNGVEVRIREMKERMEAAIEERDRVEDEANVRDRRLMREVEDARNKMRDAQRQLKGLEDERDELEMKNREWRRQRQELEQQAQDAKKDMEEVNQAMKGLRDALDESERQIREGETQRAELRRQGDETSERLEKLTRTNKTLSEEIKKLQETSALRKSSVRPVGDGGPQTSRTSRDSARSPAPPLIRGASVARSDTPISSAAAGSGNVGLSQGTVDYVYLKNVLLQFMEQRDKAHQRQLVPVLGMLLHFDKKDEQKWMSAITSR